MKAIIFDYDDTLVKTKECKWKAIRALGLEYGLNLTDKDIQLHWGKPFDEMLGSSLKNVDSVDRLRKKYIEISKYFPMRAHKDAVKIIRNLIQTHLIGIVTSSSRQLVIEDLIRLKFPVRKFFAIQASEDTTYHKPDPRVFDAILSQLYSFNISNKEILYIGDSLADMIAANSVGIHFIGILHKESNKFPERTKTIQSLSDLIDNPYLYE